MNIRSVSITILIAGFALHATAAEDSAASLAARDDGHRASRLAALEEITVTAEKTPLDTGHEAGRLPPALERLLEEAARAERGE
jgi:hypothetical protein